MNIGIDTNFIIQVVEGRSEPLRIWQEAVEGLHRLTISTLTIGEIFLYFMRRGYLENASKWLDAIQQAHFITIAPVSIPIATRSAYLRHSLSLSTVDATILATFLESGCDKMLTADDDFRVAAQQRILLIEFLNP